MNKAVIDFPPGGAGHFIARVLKNEYNFVSGKLGEFHSLPHGYQSITADKRDFLQQFYHANRDEDIVCLHNFHNLDLSEFYPCHKLVNIYIDDNFDLFANNFYRKAIGSNTFTRQEFLEQVTKKFPDSPCPLREEFFYFYSWLKTSEWSKPKLKFSNLPFSFIYNFKKLTEFLTQQSFILPPQWSNVHNDFLEKQGDINYKTNCYKEIVNAVIQKENIIVPSNLDDIDYGIVSAIIFEKTQKDVLNLTSHTWFNNTKEILEYVGG